MTTPAVLNRQHQHTIAPADATPTTSTTAPAHPAPASESRSPASDRGLPARITDLALDTAEPADDSPESDPPPLWLRSGLDEIGAAFTAMTGGPDPVGINCTPWTGLGLPGEFLTLRELRDWMLDHPRAYDARDAVWRHLVVTARRDPQWLTAAAGMAHPALVTAAIRAGRGYTGDRRDLDNDILTGFLAAVGAVDVDSGRLYERLRWAALRAGLAARWDQQPCLLVADIEAIAGAAPRWPYGHPDLIVARAVTAAVIDAGDADLILRTRLDTTPIEEIATAVGLDPAVLRMRRRRAELALAAAITGGHLSGAISPDCRQTLDRAATRRTRRTTT